MPLVARPLDIAVPMVGQRRLLLDAATSCTVYMCLGSICMTQLQNIKFSRCTDDCHCDAGPLSRSVVLLCSHSLFQGTYGLVINKLMDSQHHPGAKCDHDPDLRPSPCREHDQPAALPYKCCCALPQLHKTLLMMYAATV